MTAETYANTSPTETADDAPPPVVRSLTGDGSSLPTIDADLEQHDADEAETDQDHEDVDDEA